MSNQLLILLFVEPGENITDRTHLRRAAKAFSVDSGTMCSSGLTYRTCHFFGRDHQAPSLMPHKGKSLSTEKPHSLSALSAYYLCALMPINYRGPGYAFLQT